jgi:hypothetical protein
MRQRAYLALWGLLLALYVLLALPHLDDYAWDYDEGPLLQAADLARRGYTLYDEVVLNKLPFLVRWLQVSFATGGRSVTTARLAVLLLTLLGFASLGALAELWWGRGAGPATLALALAAAEVRVRAPVVMPDLPAMSLVLAALVAATRYRRGHGRGWLLAAAVAFALGVGLHPLLLYAAAPLAWLLVAPAGGRLDVTPATRALLTVGGVGLLLLGATLLSVDRVGFLRWVYAYNATAARNAGRHFPSWARLGTYLRQHAPLVLAALAGGALLLATGRRAHHRGGLSVCLVWAFMSLMALGLYRPLWMHYRVLSLYPLWVLAGGGAVAALRVLRTLRTQRRRITLGLGAAVTLLATPVAVAQGWATSPDRPSAPAGAAALRGYLAPRAAPGAFVLYDNPFLAFAHGYPVPPSLADSSFKRIANGYLGVGDLGRAVLDRDVRLWVLDGDDGRLGHYPTLVRAVTALTTPGPCFDALCVYHTRDRRPAEARLGEAVRLRGYALPEHGVQAGGTLTVTLYWEAVAPVPGSLSVFVHLRDAEGAMVAQHDGAPLLGAAPTETWEVGWVVADPHPVPLPPALSEGYTLAVGMYRWPSLVRLPAFDAQGTRWPDDVILLEEAMPE